MNLMVSKRMNLNQVSILNSWNFQFFSNKMIRIRINLMFKVKDHKLNKVYEDLKRNIFQIITSKTITPLMMKLNRMKSLS